MKSIYKLASDPHVSELLSGQNIHMHVEGTYVCVLGQNNISFEWDEHTRAVGKNDLDKCSLMGKY